MISKNTVIRALTTNFNDNTKVEFCPLGFNFNTMFGDSMEIICGKKNNESVYIGVWDEPLKTEYGREKADFILNNGEGDFVFMYELAD